jgi:hypothetical protein
MVIDKKKRTKERQLRNPTIEPFKIQERKGCIPCPAKDNNLVNKEVYCKGKICNICPELIAIEEKEKKKALRLIETKQPSRVSLPALSTPFQFSFYPINKYDRVAFEWTREAVAYYKISRDMDIIAKPEFEFYGFYYGNDDLKIFPLVKIDLSQRGRQYFIVMDEEKTMKFRESGYSEFELKRLPKLSNCSGLDISWQVFYECCTIGAIVFHCLGHNKIRQQYAE